MRKRPARERMIKFLELLDLIFQESDCISKSQFEKLCEEHSISKNQQRAIIFERRALWYKSDDNLYPSADFQFIIEDERQCYKKYLKERNEL